MADLVYTRRQGQVLQRLDPGRDFDCAHDAWIELQGPTCRTRQTMGALMWRTKRRALDRRRRERLQTAQYLAERLPLKQVSSPDSLVLESERNELIRASVRRLPLRYKEVVTLRFFEQLPVQQISARLA